MIATLGTFSGVTYYQTTDGEQFTSLEEAESHEAREIEDETEDANVLTGFADPMHY